MNDLHVIMQKTRWLLIKLPDVPEHIYLLREDLSSNNKTNLKRYMEKSSH